VAHLTGGRYISHHSFGTNLHPMSNAVYRAAAHAGQNQLAIGGVVKIDVNFGAAESGSDFVGDTLDDLVQVQAGSDPLGELLETHQLRNLETGGFRRGQIEKVEISTRTGGHDQTLLTLRSSGITVRDSENQASDSLFVRLDVVCRSFLISSRRSRILFSIPSLVGW